MRFVKQAAAAGLWLAVGAAFAAQGSSDAPNAPSVQPAAAVERGLTRGVVTNVDAEQGKLTIRHEALDNLDMPPMTMVFRTADPALLAAVKAGQPVAFRAERIDGVLVVTRLLAR